MDRTQRGEEAIAGGVRYLELELESVRPLHGPGSTLRDPVSFALPTDDAVVICDRPSEGGFRLVRVAEEEVLLPHPSGLHPRLVAEDGDGRILAVGTGSGFNAALLALDGRELRRYDLGEGIADVCYDPDGNILVLRSIRRGPRPLLDRYGPEGDHVERDEQIRRIMDHTTRTTGRMLLVQSDGTVWLDLSEKYDVDGALLDVIEPAEVFGPGRVTADRFGWDGVAVLGERGNMTAFLPLGRRRVFRIPGAAVLEAIGRPLSAGTDLLATRGEKLAILATDRPALLTFRMLSE